MGYFVARASQVGNFPEKWAALKNLDQIGSISLN
jgi:hypothetical protein